MSFFQAFRGALAATNRRYVPAEKAEWYTDWLLRLNLGELAAKQATEGWLPGFKATEPDGQLLLLSGVLSEFLPDIQGKFFLLTAYASTLDLRIQATTETAFGNEKEGQRLRSEAVLLDGRLADAIRSYATGGGVFYTIESDQGLLITESPQYGKLFHLWTEPTLAKEIHGKTYGGAHRISCVHYRDTEVELKYMRSAGVRYVTIDRRISGTVKFHNRRNHLSHTIGNFDRRFVGIRGGDAA